MAITNTSSSRTLGSKSVTLTDMVVEYGSVGDSETGKGDWATSSIYFPYKKNDVVYYYSANVFGSFLANVDTSVKPDDENNGYLYEYPTGNWTLIANGHTSTGKPWDKPFQGRGNWSSQVPNDKGDIIYYENGGAKGSYRSLIDSNSTAPDDLTNGYDGSDTKYWELIQLST